MRRVDFEPIVSAALAEDLDGAGDITTTIIVPIGVMAKADMVARTAGVVAGLDVAAEVFSQVDPQVQIARRSADGDHVDVGEVIASVSGPARSILTAERTALNLLGRMSGVATATAELVAKVEGTRAAISDTRKTMPGIRLLDKYAVTVGGGVNHRMGLHDAVMIKDNHLIAGMTIRDGVAAARAGLGPGIHITVEVENLSQLEEVVETTADRVLLDNMTPEMLAEAVALVAGRLETEASGGITPENIRAVALAGVDIVSVGWITHSAPQMDIALEFRSAS